MRNNYVTQAAFKLLAIPSCTHNIVLLKRVTEPREDELCRVRPHSREDVPNVGVVGAAVRCASIAAVGSAVFATLSTAILYKVETRAVELVKSQVKEKLFCSRLNQPTGF